MNTPGGKDGARTRMYHPRFGRWIVQSSVEVSLSYNKISYVRDERGGLGAHHNVFDNLVVRQESFLHRCEVSFTALSRMRVAATLALYHTTLSDPSA